MKLKKFLLFISLFIIILHPYTIYGKPAIPVCIIYLLSFFRKKFDISFVFLFKIGLLLILLSISGVINSFINDIPQLNHLISSATFLLLIIVFYKLSKNLININVDDFTLLKYILLILTINCILILIELFYNPLRLFIESFLDPLDAGTINYAVGYKFRGLASSGGAGLSIILPVISLISVYLISKKKLTIYLFLIVTLIIFTTGTLIGRTGLIQTIVLNIFYLFYFFRSFLKNIFFNLKYTIILILFSFITFYFVDFLLDFYNDTFGYGFSNYAFKFILDGKDGFEEEGTASILLEYIRVLPTEFPYFILGYGFYGGSNFQTWTDSGFARTFLSLGFPLGIIYYIFIFKILTISIKFNKFILIPFLTILVISEIKEPLLFSGIASRIFLLISIFYFVSKNSKNINIENFTHNT